MIFWIVFIDAFGDDHWAESFTRNPTRRERDGLTQIVGHVQAGVYEAETEQEAISMALNDDNAELEGCVA